MERITFGTRTQLLVIGILLLVLCGIAGLELQAGTPGPTCAQSRMLRYVRESNDSLRHRQLLALVDITPNRIAVIGREQAEERQLHAAQMHTVLAAARAIDSTLGCPAK
jgi:hypothetical protein